MRIVVVVAMLVAFQPSALAGPTAEQLFDEGQAAYDQHDYARAIDRWQESYRLGKEPALLFNIGQAYRLIDDCEHALSTYKLFIASDPTSEQRPLADEFVRELTPKCDAAKATPDARNTSSTSPAPSLVAEPKGERAEHPTGILTTRRKVAIGVAASGAASLVAAIVLGTTAINKKNDAFALCPDPQTPCADAGRAYDLTLSGHRIAIGADVMFGCAGAASIVAGVLWFTGAQGSPGRLAVMPTSQGVVMLGRF